MRKLKYSIVKITMGIIVSLTLINCSEDDEANLGPMPVADFTADIEETTFEVGTIITFTDASTNEPSLYTWQMSGGSPTYSNASSVAVEFLADGEQSVTLTARNDAGADEITKYFTVTPLEIPDLEDAVPTVKMRFENNLVNEGSIGGAGVKGSSSYEARSKYGGMAMKFNATSGQDVVLENYNGVNGNNARTVACWVKAETQLGNVGMVHWGASGTYSRASFKFQKAGQIRFEWQGGGINSVALVNDNIWHHVAYSYNGTKVKLYVDGVLDTEFEATTINTGNAGETNVTIGSQAGGARYKGLMDDVRIYDQELTAGQIQFLSTIK